MKKTEVKIESAVYSNEISCLEEYVRFIKGYQSNEGCVGMRRVTCQILSKHKG